MDWQRDVADATEFVEGLKLDLFQDQVFVFTPKGDVKDLPAGSTPLDFAYRIHTDVGHSTIGAKVNNRLVPLDYKLQERRHRRDRHHQGRARPVARLAEDRRDRPRQGKDPRSGSSARSATRTSSTAASRSSASCAAWRGRHSRSWARSASPRWPSCIKLPDASTTSTPPSATARSRRSRWSRGSRSSTTRTSACCPQVAPPPAGAHGRRPRQGRRRPDDPLRQVLPSRSRATRSSATSRAAAA